MSYLAIILWTIILIWIIWLIWNYVRVRRAAKFISVSDFADKMHAGQVVDLREPVLFQKKHILGARNLPATQFDQSLSALRKDKPVLLYDSMRGAMLPRCVLSLKKAGFAEVYVLKDGFDNWTGKTKG